MFRHPLVQTLRNLKGNARSAVFTEPLWGIPFNLYAPYASVYMLALGLSDSQIGTLASLGAILQIVTALFSGALTDKLGRRLATFVFDIVAWSIPILFLAFAKNFTYFVIAVILNSAWRITMNSWTCLLVEDAEKDQLVHIWTWVSIAGLLAAFFAPIAGILIHRYNLIPTVRGLYLFAFGMMTLKFFLLYFYSTETSQGMRKMEETRHQSILSLLAGYRQVIIQILNTPRTLITLGIMLLMSITWMVSGTFWSILVTEELLIPTGNLAIFPFIRSIVMLFFFFLVTPSLSKLQLKHPMLLGYAGFLTSTILLIRMPEKNYLLLIISVMLEACGAALFNPLLDSLVVLSVDPQERARIMAILYVVVITFTSPFGWVTGRMSEINRFLPFYLNLGLFILGVGLSILSSRYTPQRPDTTDTNPIQTSC